MDSRTVSATLIKWQRVSIATLVLALLATGFYTCFQLRRATAALAASERQAELWQKEAAQAAVSLEKEQQVTEGLKSCMTFDRAYIHRLEARFASQKRP